MTGYRAGSMLWLTWNMLSGSYFRASADLSNSAVSCSVQAGHALVKSGLNPPSGSGANAHRWFEYPSPFLWCGSCRERLQPVECGKQRRKETTLQLSDERRVLVVA